MLLKMLIGAILTILLGPLVINAQRVLFSEDFESDLSQWIGKYGGAHSGVIVLDPLDPSNQVVAFRELTGFGDIFSYEFRVIRGEIYVLHFDYLGLPMVGSVPGNLGGFAGWSQDLNLTMGRWLAGTILSSGATVELIDDGAWHTYAIAFEFLDFLPSNTTIRVMFEDWDGAHGVPGDAFFDNIRVKEMTPLLRKGREVYVEGKLQTRSWEDPVEPTTWGRIKALYQ